MATETRRTGYTPLSAAVSAVATLLFSFHVGTTVWAGSLDYTSGSGSYIDPKITFGDDSKRVETKAWEKKTPAQIGSERRSSYYKDSHQTFGFLYAGIGGANSSITQAGNGSSSSGLALNIGIERDGQRAVLPLEANFHGTLNSGLKSNDTSLMVFLATPAYNNVKAAIGIGYGGFGFEQPGGTQYFFRTGNTSNIPDSIFHARSEGTIGGMRAAVRVGYYGPENMLRLTYYMLSVSDAKNGTTDLLDDPIGASLGGTNPKFESYVKGVNGRMKEARLDFYHKLLGEYLAGKYLTGVGVTAIYRDSKIDGGSVDVFDFSSFTTTGKIVFPELTSRQFEVHMKVGYMW